MAASDVSTNQHEAADVCTRYFLPSRTFSFPIALSNADIISPVCYTRVITFYKQEGLDGSSFDIHAARLTRGFQAAVDLFPVVSGVMTQLERGNYNVEAPTTGASLTIQSASSIVIAALEANNFKNSSIPPCLAAPSWLVGAGEAMVQGHVTRLLDGVAVGLTMHHLLGDGPATFNFLGVWAELSRVGELVAACPPVMDRSLLAASRDVVPRLHPELVVSPPALPPSADDEAAPASAWVLPEMEAEYIHFTPEALARLKQACTDSLPAAAAEHGSWISTNDAITSLFWRGYTRARGLGETPDQPTACIFACDCRQRLQPALPPGFFGNVNFLGYSKLSAGSMLDHTIGEIALEIRAATERNNDARIRSALAFIEAMDDKSRVKMSTSYFMGQDVMLTNWSKFRLHDIDFGFGKPLAVRLPASRFDGLCAILAAADGGLDVLGGLMAPHWKKLMSDPEFTQFASPVA